MADDEDSPIASRLAESGKGDHGNDDGGQPGEGLADEDVPDWRAFAKFAKSMSRKGDITAPEPFIPRRGEKDFEPSKDTATYQEVQLQESRNALFAALSAGTRHHSSKIHNAGVWHPSLSRASMDPLRTKGIHFTIMGRHEPTRKRLELLPEETLYLIERGTLECYTERQENLGFAEGVEGGVPFSVQHAFSEMLGREGLTAERYQVYAYLRRLGYAVFRAGLHTAGDDFSKRPSKVPILRRIRRAASRLARSLAFALYEVAALPLRITSVAISRIRRLHFRPLSRGNSLVGTQYWSSYDKLFTALQIIPSGHDSRLPSQPSPKVLPPSLSPHNPTSSQPPPQVHYPPYSIFFHVYRPSTKVRKSALPPPDFYLAVCNAQKDPVPDLYDLTKVFESLPFPPGPSRAANSTTILALPAKVLSQALSFLRSLLSISSSTSEKRNDDIIPDNRRKRNPPSYVNPVSRIKNGRRNFILAVVDSGTISFMKFSEAEFGKVPLVGKASPGIP